MVDPFTLLEVAAIAARPDDAGRITLSSAISLKRIADALEIIATKDEITVDTKGERVFIGQQRG